MKDAFVEKVFSPAKTAMIDRINAILDEYRAAGYRLSLRQLYYQLVARDIIENTLRSYQNIGSLVSDARQAGLIDWGMIEDRNRETVSVSHWDSPADILFSAASSFRIDKWKDQPWHIEVMCEKDALSGVLIPVCRRLDISLTANKGYSSSSTMYEIGQRLSLKFDDNKKICVVYLGDHDPSGIDMSRDVEDRLKMYSRLPGIEIVRVALNFDQVEMWQPPENPAKTTDSRFKSYVKKFGSSSWELDAVSPERLSDLVERVVKERRDETLWNDAVFVEAEQRDTLRQMAHDYLKEHPAED